MEKGPRNIQKELIWGLGRERRATPKKKGKKLIKKEAQGEENTKLWRKAHKGTES